MRTIESTKVFRRDYKKVIATPRYREIAALVESIGDQLASDAPLDVRYRDHPLSGVYTGCRECHLKPDLLTVYAKEPLNNGCLVMGTASAVPTRAAKSIGL